jgi:predicted TIM-barrel fold metal-dependent hydrolase
VRRVVNAGTQVWVKLSASYRLGGVNACALAQLWVAELGPHRLLWGSDWPCTNHEALADYAALRCSLAQWVDAASMVEAISSTNPQQLLA